MDEFIWVTLTLVVGLAVGVGFGVSMERNYQCEKVGGQMVGSSTCIKGSEVVIRW